MINAGKQGVFSWKGRVAEDKGEKNGEYHYGISETVTDEHRQKFHLGYRYLAKDW